jgi:hypothetical protein
MSTIHILHYGEREVIQLLVLILLSRFKYLMYICHADDRGYQLGSFGASDPLRVTALPDVLCCSI